MSILFGEVREVGGRDLQRVEDGTGGAAVDLGALEGADHLHEGELEGGGILDEGDEARVGKGVFDEVMKAAEGVFLERGLGAGLVVEADVLAARGGVGLFVV